MTRHDTEPSAPGSSDLDAIRHLVASYTAAGQQAAQALADHRELRASQARIARELKPLLAAVGGSLPLVLDLAGDTVSIDVVRDEVMVHKVTVAM